MQINELALLQACEYLQLVLWSEGDAVLNRRNKQYKQIQASILSKNYN